MLVPDGGRVVELGCGVAALPSLTLGAARGCSVMATDGREEPLAFVRTNAAANRVSCETSVVDITAPGAGDAVRNFGPDVIVAADLLYDASLHEPFAAVLASAGVPALLADPNRPTAPRAVEAFERAGVRVWRGPLATDGPPACQVLIVEPGE